MHCGYSSFYDGNLVLSLFLVGLFGGASHCSTMCGPFVVSQVCVGLGAIPASNMTELTRLKGAALIPYHLGRATSYTTLAIIAYLIGSLIQNITIFKSLSALCLSVAGVIFVSYALRSLGLPVLDLLTLTYSNVYLNKINKRASFLFANPHGFNGYLLGVLLGFIPCGLVFGAVIAVMGSSNLGTAITAMLAFTLGTVPTLLVIGIGAHLLIRKKTNKWFKNLSFLLLLLSGIMLLALAGTQLYEIIF